MTGKYNRCGEHVRYPAWQDDPEPPEYDLDPQDIDFLEQDEAYEAMMEDFDRRVSDLYDTQNGDIETDDSDE